MKKSRRSRKSIGADKVIESTSPVAEISGASKLRHNPLIHAIFVIAVGTAVYANTFAVPFFFDDFPYLKSNPLIRDFGFFLDPEKIQKLGIYFDVRNNFLLRPVAYFTFALNYAFHGLDTWGYHLFNLLVHLGNGLLVYLLSLLTLRTPAVEGEKADSDKRMAHTHRYLPLFGALLFIGHPLQTQAVTYIIQRFTSLCAFLVLGSLTLYVIARLSPRKSVQLTGYLLSLAACVLAMLSKESAFVVPVIIAMYEFIFFTGKTGTRVVRLIPFLLTMTIIPLNLMNLPSIENLDQAEAIGDAINLVNFRGRSSWDYLMTQFGVITRYLKLLLLPTNQNFDYDYPLQTDFLKPAVLLPLTLLGALIVGGIWLLVLARRRNRPESGLHAMAAFGIFWFFVTQAVESSVVPIDDLIFEHRAYLPSVGFFLAALAGAASLYGSRRNGASMFSSRTAVVVLTLAVLAYAVAGYFRNSLWTDKITFWRDVVSKSPNKARPHVRLGLALLEEPFRNRSFLNQMKSFVDFSALGIPLPGLALSPASQEQVDEAVSVLRTAVRIRPKSVGAHVNLGDALMLQGNFDGAASEFKIAQGLAPSNYLPYLSHGSLHEFREDYENARSSYREAIRIAPNAHAPRAALAALYAKEGKKIAALKEYEIVWQLFPDREIREKIADLKTQIKNEIGQ